MAVKRNQPESTKRNNLLHCVLCHTPIDPERERVLTTGHRCGSNPVKRDVVTIELDKANLKRYRLGSGGTR